MIEKYIKKSYINNYSDILTFSKDKEFKKLVYSLDKNKKIKIKSKLIHNKNSINQIEQFIFNLDNYISFIKNFIYIKPQELRYIIYLTLYNKKNKILYSDLYYYDNINIYKQEFINLFMYKYEYNYKIYSKFIKTKKKNFEELTNIINNKKRTYVYFEKLSKNNIPFYLELYKSIESN